MFAQLLYIVLVKVLGIVVAGVSFGRSVRQSTGLTQTFEEYILTVVDM